MKQGQAGRGLACGLLGLVAVGCGSPDSEKGARTPDCGTVQEPLVLALKDVKPASGSSLVNVDITQSFTIVGRLLSLNPSFELPAAHTAGEPIPSVTSWTVAASGSDTVYTSLPMSWTRAPGHVELNPPGLLSTKDGCIFVLPTPTFSYDITAP